MTIAGEDVIANDIYVVENGEMLYPYRIRVRDLPEAGLLVNSAQIFINFDRTMLTWRKAEGMVDWTITENDSALMATWASDTEVLLKNEDVILTLWFAGTDNVKPGDAVQIHGRTTGVVELVLGEMRRDDQIVAKAERGTWVTFKAPRCRVGDKVFFIEERGGGE